MPAPGPDAPPVDPAHEHPHQTAAVEEWVFACWTDDARLGVLAGVRVLRAVRETAWYWSSLVRADAPLLHVTEWDIVLRRDAPGVLKAPAFWAEHVCDAPMEQWTVSNECYAVALDEPDDALGRAYGIPTALAVDVEWYATAPPVAEPADGGHAAGYRQDGVGHGVIELPGGALHISEAPARRWHRWGDRLDPLVLPVAYAHTGLRAPFAFPDGTVADWVLTPDGFRTRRPA